MAHESSPVEQAVSRAVRDNLERLQRTVEELDQAYADLVSACSSSRPANVLPPMLRAQTAAASLAATLEVLARFITGSLHVPRAAAEEAVLQAVSVSAPPAPAPAPVAVEPPPAPVEAVAEAPRPAPPEVAPPPPPVVEMPPPAPEAVVEAVVEEKVEAPAVAEAAAPAFDVAQLSPDEQKMHERANRVAKVSMQDIKMYKPQEVKLGRENKDICVRLREDIDKAKKEYDRRFRPILNHPVDYFYQWMVEILAEGDPEALGEYPYPSPAHRR
jgi:hypothetical protein